MLYYSRVYRIIAFYFCSSTSIASSPCSSSSSSPSAAEKTSCSLLLLGVPLSDSPRLGLGAGCMGLWDGVVGVEIGLAIGGADLEIGGGFR